MITAKELHELIESMRQIGKDTQVCEVKSSGMRLSSDIVETLSAFSNGSGGCIILGLSESDGFLPTRGFNARAIQGSMLSACDKLTPVVRPEIGINDFDGALIVYAQIPEMLPRDKPCYVTARGTYNGSFIRTGDGDKKLTRYEIDRLLEEHHQPTYDAEIVPEATKEDLDSSLVDALLARQKQLHPRIFGNLSEQDALLNLRILKMDGTVPRPTIAGLLTLGNFPQKYFPRLNLTFSVFPGISKADILADGQRLLDSKTIIGPIPEMIDEAVQAVSKNMRTGAIVEGAFRKDAPDYPPVAVREAIANALMHRDYSPDSRGTQVQVNMYADRLEILNPGGLYGTVTVDMLGKSGVSSARNQYLSTILETTPYSTGGFVVENRGTGYQAIEALLDQALMGPPKAKDGISLFSLTFEKRRMSASKKSGHLAQDIDEAIIDMLNTQSSVSARELMDMSGLSRAGITMHLRQLIGEGMLEPTEPKKSPKQRYRLIKR